MTRSAAATVYSNWSTQERNEIYTPFRSFYGAADVHLTSGVSDNGQSEFCAIMVFPVGFTGIAKVTGATLYMQLTSGVHLTRVGTYPTFLLNTLNQASATNGGSYEVGLNQGTYANDNYDNTQSFNGNSSGSVQAFNIMASMWRWAPSSVYVDGYGYGNNQANHGLRVHPANNSERSEWWSATDSRKPYIYFTYELINEAPYAPAIASPADQAVQTGGGDVTVLMSNPGDIDGDSITAASIETGEVASYGATPTWTARTTTWNGSYWTATHPSPTRGNWIAIRGKAMDEHSAWSGYGGTKWALVNSLPEVVIS